MPLIVALPTRLAYVKLAWHCGLVPFGRGAGFRNPILPSSVLPTFFIHSPSSSPAIHARARPLQRSPARRAGRHRQRDRRRDHVVKSTTSTILYYHNSPLPDTHPHQ
eukprot:9486928-Pyramimonas_sp.AAC.2